MGLNSSKTWYDENQRKILILSFSEGYLNALSNFFIGKPVVIDEKIGFKLEKIDHDELKLGLWFVTCKNRHLWRHHYYGSQGVILIFSHPDVDYEVLNVFNDSNLKKVPFLILFDKTKIKIESIVEDFRKRLNSQNEVIYNTQFIDFSDNGINMINCGLDWLTEVMKPII